MTKISFTTVEAGHPHLDPGCWFFHEGAWAVCASTGRQDDGRWSVQIYFDKQGKPLREQSCYFATMKEAKDFVSDYFEQPVVDCEPDDFPKPSSL